MYVVTRAGFTAERTADVLVNQYIPEWFSPNTRLSDNGLQICAKFFQAVCELVGIRKIVMSTYYPNANGGTERVTHTMDQILAMFGNERQGD